VENRNDDLIYNYLAWGWIINMVSQWIWYPTFSSFTGWGFIISTIDILVMIGSALYMEFMSNRAEVNWAEWLFIRGGLSIYCGWLTAATILNVTALLKFYEFEGFDWYSEEAITITILYVAWFIYTLATYIELNPLYGAVFIWVCFAISAEIQDSRPEYTDLLANVQWIGILHAISITGLTSYLATLRFNDIYDQEKGLFY